MQFHVLHCQFSESNEVPEYAIGCLRRIVITLMLFGKVLNFNILNLRLLEAATLKR